ncbi:MAG: hypothetical protein ACTHK7_04305 [Aureliella sp.]
MSTLVYNPIHLGSYPDAWKDRWDFLRYFIECWFAPVLPSDGYSPRALQNLEQQLGCQLPQAIATVVRHCGCRRDIWQSLTDIRTLFQKLERIGDVIVVNTVVPMYAFPIGAGLVDPELYFWDSRNKEICEFAGRLSDQLLYTVVDDLWTGKGTERIPYFTKQVSIEPEEVKVGPNGEWLQEQEVASRMMRSPAFGVQSVSYHAPDLIVEPCYPNSFRVAARSATALDVLPEWLRTRLESDADILVEYDFYRRQGVDIPFEPPEQ